MSLSPLPKSLMPSSPLVTRSPRSPRRRGVYPESAPYTAKASPRAANNKVSQFINENLQNAKSIGEKLYVYQQAFDLLICEFQACRPVVEKIKQYYDTTANDLLRRYRFIITEKGSETSADDAYADAINTMRHAKNHEFAEYKETSEKRLDEMTSLRIRHLELSKQIESSKKERDDMIKENEFRAQQIKEFLTRMETYLGDTKTESLNCNELRKNIDDVKKEITELNDSISILNGNKEEREKNIADLIAELSSNEEEIKKIEADTKQVNDEISDLNASNIELTMKNETMETKIEAQRARIAELEKTYREKIGDTETPLEKLLGIE